ncbi:MAG: hypothetical protein ACXWZR_13605 [Mycobacterium sp.]
MSYVIARAARGVFSAAIVGITGVGIALGACALGDLGIANAAAEWDIGEYDECLKGDVIRGKLEEQHCCDMSGGVWNGDAQKCVAPPRDAQGRTVREGLPTHTLTPVPATAPPGGIIQTFTPAP